MSDDTEAAQWAALRADVAQPSDPHYTRIFGGEPEPQPEPERDPFAAYRSSDVRTFIPKEEHGDVRSDDVFEWTTDNDDGSSYYLWRQQVLAAEWSRVLPALSPAEIADWMEKRPGPAPTSESAFWLEVLPPPPQPLHAADEDDILMWLRGVAKAGGMPGLQFGWSPENFPFGSYQRSRCTHLHGTVCREIEAESKRRAEEAARANAEKQRDEMRELFRQKGWR